MKILLIGKNGQIGFELNRKLKKFGEIVSTDRKALDLADADKIIKFIDKEKPDIIINAAAYTAVDKAESEPLVAHQINTIAPKILADMAAKLNVPLIHFSTDYVFDGLKESPYIESDAANPQSIYGKTKYEGELAVRQYRKHIILRTSWVFGYHGNNFLKTILRFIKEKNSLNIVSDQWGSPASSKMLAQVTCKIVDNIFNDDNYSNFGTYHVTSRGETNWYQFAIYIFEEATRFGYKGKLKKIGIKAINTADYPLPAKRPMNSRLSIEKIEKTFMLKLPSWQIEVKKVLKEIIH